MGMMMIIMKVIRILILKDMLRNKKDRDDFIAIAGTLFFWKKKSQPILEILFN